MLLLSLFHFSELLASNSLANSAAIGGSANIVAACVNEAHMKTCPECNGDGVVEKGTDDEQQCPTCGGRGFVPDDDDGHEEVIKTSPIKMRGPGAR